MGRPVQMWMFLLCLMMMALFTVVFGSAVRTTMQGANTSPFGRTAVQVAAFPQTAAEVIRQLSSYAAGDYADESNRVLRDAGADYSGFTPVETAEGIAIDGLMMRATPGAAPGWRMLAGAFHVDGAVENAVLLMSPEHEVVRRWILDEIPTGGETPRAKYRKFVHGVELLPDGSVIFTFDGSISLQKFDACGARQWATAGGFHHSVTLDDTRETVWTFSKYGSIAQVDVSDGTILKEISIYDVIAKNPETDILEIRRKHATDLGLNSRNTRGQWDGDPFHFNDVEALPAALADRFPGFEAGDLLLSARSLNLVFVLDPDTLRIKWWRAGAVQRQHDPDWMADGRIGIFNNRMSRDYSEIVALDPQSFDREVLLDGRDHGFYTRIRGKQEIRPDGSLVVTSPQQGWVFETDASGRRVLELANTKPGDDTMNYVISEMKWLPLDYFTQEAWTSCQISN